MKTETVQWRPESLSPEVIYIIRNEERGIFAMSTLCPCGCGQVVYLSLEHQFDPHWELEQHDDGTVTISPSVQQLGGCGSHYFIRRNEIQWC